MKMQEFVDYLDKKIEESGDFIKITFYEVRVKCNLTEKEEKTFLTLAKNRFENMGYNTYFINDQYTYKNQKMTVKSNELMIAIRGNNV